MKKLWKALRRPHRQIVMMLAVSVGFVAVATFLSLEDFPADLMGANAAATKPQVMARDGSRLSISLQNAWNTTDTISLDHAPLFLQRAFILSEDQHFYQHGGVDWRARAAAFWQNVKAGGAVRGASTITEQVVRMLHPRPRNVWSRWLEGFEAYRFESRFDKTDILAFYLNQVPYAERRRGIAQAAKLYFDRDISTLTQREMLALVVLVRSPSGMDLRRNPERAKLAIDRLAQRLLKLGEISTSEFDRIKAEELVLNRYDVGVRAEHFVSFVLDRSARQSSGSIKTTLDPWLQNKTQEILDSALVDLARRKVNDAAVLVIDHKKNEVLAWVVSHDPANSKDGARQIGYDSVLVPRQPGSTMKPLLYALALEKGWTAATLIDDSELAESVGSGLHTFHNYSRTHYGPIRLREALANSLNVPAAKTLKFVGGESFLNRLHSIGINSLAQHADFYGDGLALGNGEISLFEMAQAYAVLARQGKYLPLQVISDESNHRDQQIAFSPEVASLISNILADSEARSREFGNSLQFPVETAIKTGTSNDYRDAWAIAFDYAHTVAVWMGNLDNSSMNGVTGSIGPALVARSIFSELNRNQDTKGLYLSKSLVPIRICSTDGNLARNDCPTTVEWFIPGHLPRASIQEASPVEYRLKQPTPGLYVAHDPRIPPEFEALTLAIEDVPNLRKVEWVINGKIFAQTSSGNVSWPLITGTHTVSARIWSGNGSPHVTDDVRFYVK